MRSRGRETNGGRAAIGPRSRFDGRRQALALRAIPLFAGCSKSELQLVDQLTCESRVAPGRVLVREGRPADQLLVVMWGRARISIGGESLWTAEAGACVGGHEMCARTMSSVTMTAETPMLVRAASAREVRSLIVAIPRLAYAPGLAIHRPRVEVAERVVPEMRTVLPTRVGVQADRPHRGPAFTPGRNGFPVVPSGAN